jgi:ribosomal protein S18 acetylase RimI-like enzyme
MGQGSGATIVIRPCRVEECAAVLALWERAGAIPSPTDTLEELQRLVRTHGDGFLVAIEGSAVVGSVIGGWDGWRGNIYRLAVAPEARRRGLARRLVRTAERALTAMGARRMSALVERHEAHAVGFWDSLAADGWRRDERMMRYIKTD